MRRLHAVLPLAVILSLSLHPAPRTARADEAPGAGPLVKLLQSGKLPPDRQPTVINLIGQRGTADDLAVVFALVAKPAALQPAVRRAALEALLDAAQTRKVSPTGDRAALAALLSEPRADEATLILAVRLAGAWKEPATEKALAAVALAKGTGPDLRAETLDALIRLGGKDGRAAALKLAAPDQPTPARLQAVTALVRQDAGAAADAAADVLAKAAGTDDPAPLLAAFLETKGGSDKLAQALRKVKVPADPAKLALRALFAAGRSDAALLEVLSAAAGIGAAKELTKKDVDDLVEEARSKGDPVRGEKVFRRADLSCIKCHPIAGGGGNVGPELQAIGSTSQPDYLLRSILYPDESVKEEYLTQVVTTSDGKQFQGIVVEDTPAKLVLKDATGELKTVSKADIEDRQKGKSLMPQGLAGLMTRSELVDVVRFLAELGKPGSKYPLQSAPVLRRWRVLGGLPAELVKEVPDELAFKARVLGADKAAWVPTYATHAGPVPLDDLPGAKAGVVYLQAEVDVKTAGKVALELDGDAGLTVWADDNLQAAAKRLTFDLEPGRHKLTFRVDLAKRGTKELRAELVKEEGSEAEVTPVGGP